MSEKIKLSGGPDKTATWIWLEDGLLNVEHYDFSQAAQRLFGNDSVYIDRSRHGQVVFDIEPE